MNTLNTLNTLNTTLNTLNTLNTLEKPGKPQFLVYNTRDDRREILILLSMLDPLDCVRWLDRVCQKISHHGTRPGPNRRTWERAFLAKRKGGEYADRLAAEVYGDLWMLSSQYGLDIDDTIQDLESLVRRKRLKN